MSEKNKTKKCYICNTEMIQHNGLINNPFNKNQQVFATYYKCSKCDEIIFEGEITRRLEQIAKDDTYFSITESVNIVLDDMRKELLQNKLTKNKLV